MRINAIQNNNDNSPYFKGKIKLFKDGRYVKLFGVSKKNDVILYDAFLKATYMERFGTGFGCGFKDVNYNEYLKTLKELSGIDTVRLTQKDTKDMYGFSRTYDRSHNTVSYQIVLNEDKDVLIEHQLERGAV